MDEKRKAVWSALLGMILQLLMGGLILLVSGWSGSSACLSLGLFTVVTAFIWGLAFLHTRQQRLAEEEERELSETEKRGALFEGQDLGTLSAKAGLRRLELYLLPAIAVIVALLLVIVAGRLYAKWGRDAAGTITNFFMPGALVFGFGAVMLFYGMYVKGMTSVAGWRLLRAGSSAMLFAAFASLVTSVTVILGYLGVPAVEKAVAWVIGGIIGLTGLDLILSMIGNLFVPRSPGAEILPPYHSRLLDIITSPGDILKTVADMVDYQFGFRVSETWFYGFLEKAIIPLVVFWILTLYAFTCVVVVGTEEQAVLERFGRPYPEVLDSGLHFKLPWPVDIAHKFPAKAVQTITIGYKDEIEGQPAITWTEEHYREEDIFLVATREQGRRSGGEDGTEYVPVSFVTAAIKIHYRVTDLHRYLYRKANPVDFMTDIAYREVVKFLGSIDIQDLLMEKRLILADKLKGNIQKVLGDAGTGVEVFYLGFESAHPPVETGEAYESIMKALEEKHTSVLRAETYTNEVIHKALADAYTLNEEAKAYKYRRTKISEADAERFLMRMKPYNISPSVFKMRKSMDTLESAVRNIRKYIRSSGIRTTTILNLEDKLEFGVGDIDLEELKGE